jgi:hypothetical protein
VQYKIEERSIVAKRLISFERRVAKLVKHMKKTPLTLPENLATLKQEIYNFTKDPVFQQCANMGDVMEAAFAYVKSNYENVSLNKLF